MTSQELRMIPMTWPFAVWGLDMVGPFKRPKDKKTHLLVAVDKFTKWVEAEPVSGKLIHEHLWDRRTETLSVQRGAEVARRADRGAAHEQFTQLRSSPER